MDMKSELIMKFIRATLDNDTGIPETAATALYELRDAMDEDDPLLPVLTSVLAQVDATNGFYYLSTTR
jgi:hypothetical protein